MINIAILGFGIVGSGVAEVIKENSKALSERLCGEELYIKYILDKRDFPDHELGSRVIKDYDEILNDESVIIVVETMGGSHPAYEFSMAALKAGKSVVTSNKEVVANYGAELLSIAQDNNVSYLFEASVGGGIPIIRPMWQCLAANKLKSVVGILNGTTNYILTKMLSENKSFHEALTEAQELGYAEKNPSADIEGIDTCRKICILASLAFGKQVLPEKVHCEGITDISLEDIKAAERLGYSVKLLGRTELCEDEKVYVVTYPALISKDNPLSTIADVYNGVSVVGNVVGDVMFYGRGAGKLPTASAVMADVLDIVRDCRKTIGWAPSDGSFVSDYKAFKLSFFARTKENESKIKSIFPNVKMVEDGDEKVFFTDVDREDILCDKLSKLKVISKIRVLA